MHPLVIEVIALQTPCIDKHLTPFLTWRERKLPICEIYVLLLKLGRCRCIGIDNVQLARLANEQLFAIGRKLRALDFLHK